MYVKRLDLRDLLKLSIFKMSDTKFTIQLAIISRVLAILLQAVSNFVINDHNANVFVSPKSKQFDDGSMMCSSIVDMVFGGFRRWDAEYYLHIAEHGYTYENTLVFYPLYPFCVRYITNLVLTIVPLPCEFRELSLVVAILLNVIFFVNAALVLYKLTALIFRDGNIARIATTLYCFNPASIFFSAPYTESLFSWLSFSVMLHCFRSNYRAAMLPLALGMWCRSNGIINFGFVMYYVMRDACLNRLSTFKAMYKVSGAAIVAGFAFYIIQVYFYMLYCDGHKFEMNEYVENYGRKNGFILAGGLNRSAWCSFDIPFSYSYLQEKYWNVGFFKYYELKQIPNFALAAPTLIMMISHTIGFSLNSYTVVIMSLGFSNNPRVWRECNQFVYVVHALALSLFCVSYVHIQVSTRLLSSSSPYLYWICANWYNDDLLAEFATRGILRNTWKAFLRPQNRLTKFIKAWFLGYFVIGTVLFSNFLPWT